MLPELCSQVNQEDNLEAIKKDNFEVIERSKFWPLKKEISNLDIK